MTRPLCKSGPAEGSHVEILAESRLDLLYEEWAALWRACPAATPFQAPAWLLAWAEHYGGGRTWAAATRRNGLLAALLPVFSWDGELLLAGTGPSDYGDGLFLPGFEGAAARLLAAIAAQAPEVVRRIELRQLRPHSPLLDAASPPDWSDERELGEPCPVARLIGPDGLGAASKRCRDAWLYALRRIEREGGRCELVPPDELSDAVAELERLHGLRWASRGQSGVLVEPLLRRTLRSLASQPDATSVVRLHRLRFGMRTTAVLLALAGQREAHYYLSGFDPALARLSPGSVLIGGAMVQAFEEGAEEFHFLRGREAYKYRWGAEDRPTWHRRLLRGSPS